MAKKPLKIDFNEPVYDFPHSTEDGKKRATIANLKHLLTGYGITAAYDEILKKQHVVFGNAFDNSHSDLQDNSNVSHLRSLLSLNGLSLSTIDLLPAIFAENSSNPVLDWIESKPWDGHDRFLALATTLTVSANDELYRNKALYTWLIQCVAAADGGRRTTNKSALPKFELAFILQGGQGVRKTSWFGRLLPQSMKPYLVDGMHLDPADKDSVKQSVSCWICELGELDSTFKRSDVSRLKAFLSKQVDILRLSYDRCASQFGRRTSFCGSVNPEMFLVDSTGNRRFLPLQVLECDHLHDIDMQQLWAQMFSDYLEGQQWWCDYTLEGMLIERHSRHSEINPIHELIADMFDIEQQKRTIDSKHMTATKLLQECGIKEPKQTQCKFVNEFMKQCGFDLSIQSGIRGYWVIKRPFVYD